MSNLNIVAGEDVKGTVTIKLNDVPWDQALDTILLSNNLGKALDGNILRIAPIDKLEKQRKDALAAQESQAKLEPLKKHLFRLAMLRRANLNQLSKILKSFPLGEVLKLISGPTL